MFTWPAGEAVELAHLTWPEAETALATCDFALLPIAAVEEHGPHLPLDTDIRIATALARRIAAGVCCVMLPTLPYGQVYSLIEFPGSLTLTVETLIRVLVETVGSLHRHGVRRVVFLNGHGGNITAANLALRSAMAEHPAVRVLNLLPDFNRAGAEVCDSRRWHPFWLHAEEMETSLMLALAPGSVRMERAVSEYPERPPYFDHTALNWRKLSRSGVFGDATVASAEKGEQLLARLTELALEVIRPWLAAPEGAL